MANFAGQGDAKSCDLVNFQIKVPTKFPFATFYLAKYGILNEIKKKKHFLFRNGRI